MPAFMSGSELESAAGTMDRVITADIRIMLIQAMPIPILTTDTTVLDTILGIMATGTAATTVAAVGITDMVTTGMETTMEPIPIIKL